MTLPLKWEVSDMNYYMWIQMFFNVFVLREKSFRGAYSLISNVKLIFFPHAKTLRPMTSKQVEILLGNELIVNISGYLVLTSNESYCSF